MTSHDITRLQTSHEITWPREITWQSFTLTLHELSLHHITTKYTHLTDLTWYHIRSHDITWLHIRSHDLTSDHMTSHQITWHHMTSHQITWHHMTSHQITRPHMTSHQITWHYTISKLSYILYLYLLQLDPEWSCVLGTQHVCRRIVSSSSLWNGWTWPVIVAWWTVPVVERGGLREEGEQGWLTPRKVCGSLYHNFIFTHVSN